MHAFHVLFDVCKCDVFVCFDVCIVFVVDECSLFLSSICYLLCRRVGMWDVIFSDL